MWVGACVHESVCVCVRERERERIQKRFTAWCSCLKSYSPSSLDSFSAAWFKTSATQLHFPSASQTPTLLINGPWAELPTPVTYHNAAGLAALWLTTSAAVPQCELQLLYKEVGRLKRRGRRNG